MGSTMLAMTRSPLGECREFENQITREWGPSLGRVLRNIERNLKPNSERPPRSHLFTHTNHLHHMGLQRASSARRAKLQQVNRSIDQFPRARSSSNITAATCLSKASKCGMLNLGFTQREVWPTWCPAPPVMLGLRENAPFDSLEAEFEGICDDQGILMTSAYETLPYKTSSGTTGTQPTHNSVAMYGHGLAGHVPQARAYSSWPRRTACDTQILANAPQPFFLGSHFHLEDSAEMPGHAKFLLSCNVRDEFHPECYKDSLPAMPGRMRTMNYWTSSGLNAGCLDESIIFNEGDTTAAAAATANQVYSNWNNPDSRCESAGKDVDAAELSFAALRPRRNLSDLSTVDSSANSLPNLRSSEPISPAPSDSDGSFL